MVREIALHSVLEGPDLGEVLDQADHVGGRGRLGRGAGDVAAETARVVFEAAAVLGH